MAITFGGDNFDNSERIMTGCYSLDWSLEDNLGNRGIPLRSSFEVYGAKNVGKSTFCFSLMGILAKRAEKNVTILDWEGQSKITIQSVLENQGFFGNVNYLLNTAKDKSTEETLERFVEEIIDESQNVALMDSLGGFIPNAYVEGKIGDANMGVKAREIGAFVSKVNYHLMRWKEPGVVFYTNHQHPKIGSMVSGQDTSGGEQKKYLAHIRIDLKRAYIGNSAINFGESYLLRGHIDSNRHGYSLRDFYVFIVGGEGIHTGLTALWDCVMLGYAELSAKSIKDSVVVSMDGTSYGKMRQILKERKSPDFFTPFINKLREGQDVDVEEVEDEAEEEPKKRGKRK